MSDDGDRLLGELHGTLNQFMKRYDDDQKRQESYRVEDREDRRKWVREENSSRRIPPSDHCQRR
jgi:hypothetical protein